MAREGACGSALIDSPASASSLVTKFIPLKFADAATVAQIVQATLNAQAQERDTKGITTIRGQGTSAPQEANRGGQPPSLIWAGSLSQLVPA